MSLTLYVDGDRWRAHLRAVADAHPGPGAGRQGQRLRLRRCGRLAAQGRAGSGVDTARGRHLRRAARGRRRASPATLLVLTPWRPFEPAPVDPALADRVIHTVGRLEDLAALLGRASRDARFVLERLDVDAAPRLHRPRAAGGRRAAGRAARRVRLEGVALHLPLAQGSHLPRCSG